MTPDHGLGIMERKRALRRELRARRAELTVAARAAASRDASWHVLRSLPWRERRKVALFWSLAEEIDTRPLLHSLHWLGAEPLLPRMQGRGRPLLFHAWSPRRACRPCCPRSCWRRSWPSTGAAGGWATAPDSTT